MKLSLFEKIWRKHVVSQAEGYADLLYVDAHFIHEVTSPQAFDGLRKRNLPVFRPERTFATADHNVPTKNQHLPIAEPLSRKQVETLRKNCQYFGLELYDLENPNQGIVHVIGPELGITQPGKTIVCGDSHTSTHGAFGTIAFGIGTSEVEQVLATQCILQTKPKTMRIEINGKLKQGVYAKDLILHIISQLTSSGATGYFIEYTGTCIRNLSMEARMTICNMSIEMGARGGLIAPDTKTFAYLQDRPFAPKGKAWTKNLALWKQLYSDSEAQFDKMYTFEADFIEPMLTYGTNPDMGIGISQAIPSPNMINTKAANFQKALDYMGLKSGQKLIDLPIDYAFIGSCTNARIEDLRLVAHFVKGKRKADHVFAWVVPGSKRVERQAQKEGLDKILQAAGFELRQPGCSACLGMNDDKVPPGKYCISTSNRNFQGRQGPNARTILASPIMTAAAAIAGKIVDVRQFLDA